MNESGKWKQEKMGAGKGHGKLRFFSVVGQGESKPITRDIFRRVKHSQVYVLCFLRPLATLTKCCGVDIFPLPPRPVGKRVNDKGANLQNKERMPHPTKGVINSLNFPPDR